MLTKGRAMLANDTAGQAIVEFALLLPLFLLLLIGLVEYAFALNALNSANFASRDAAVLAAEAGSIAGSDCVVLKSVEKNIGAPSRPERVQQVDIYWSDDNGQQIGAAANSYQRTGSTTCTFNDGTRVTVPYTLSGAPGYAESSRCDVLAGCGAAHPELDTVAVRITYQHTWLTPFPGLLPTTGSGYTFVQTNATRMEPKF